ncbi:hypothetical protein GDO81_025259 [Engystomops pustulosus]|uniref:C2H2-type domain-containing protein n=1 Tax=Engystomops pustulosus TaxID=76066 RepID=A0AAV6ZAB3_ENGPU|nr:hypothetical protein GDO81_025259 [Engystomops pustulosus]
MLDNEQRELYMEVMRENYEHFIFLNYKVPIILSWQQNRTQAARAPARPASASSSSARSQSNKPFQGTEIGTQGPAVGNCIKTAAVLSQETPPELQAEPERSVKLPTKRPRPDDDDDDDQDHVQLENHNKPISPPTNPPKRKMLHCPHCDKYFRYSSALEAHLRVHSGERPHKCDLCNETFSYKSGLIVHRRKHSRASASLSGDVENSTDTARNPPQYSKPTKSKKSRTHKRKKRKGKSRTTSKMEAAPKTSYNGTKKANSIAAEPSKVAPTNVTPTQNSHVAPEAGTTPATNSTEVNKQNGEAGAKTGLTNGEASKSATTQPRTTGQFEIEKPLKCSFCEKRFNSPLILEAHTRIHTGKQPHPCPFCDESFSKASLLAAHASTHKEFKPYQCDQCDKNFKDHALFITHQKTHTGEKPHQCSKCDQWFPNRTSLLAHEDTHLKPKPYQCRHCEKSFNDKGLLIAHEGVHTDTKPYKCNHCSDSFYMKTQLVAHQAVHAPEKPFPCSQCEKSFYKKETLVAHIRVHKVNSAQKT